jgi:GT2 family glycosyltransferase
MGTQQPVDVSIILVGLNACKYIRQCLESIGKAIWRDYTYEVIYVDNGSTDNTLQMLKDDCPEVKVIANASNLGYCRAANQAAEIANSRYYFFLNDDTIVLDDAIPLLSEFLDKTPQAAIVGSRLVYPDMTEQWSGRKFPSLSNAILGRRSFLTKLFPNAKAVRDYLCKEQLKGKEPFEVDWVSAAAMMVHKETFIEINGLAEDYYYWHESIFCDRAIKSEKKVYLHPVSKIIHYEGKGSGARPFKVQKFHILNFHEGAFRCYCEHYNLSIFNPLRWFVGAALYTRACLLLAATRFANLK